MVSNEYGSGSEQPVHGRDCFNCGKPVDGPLIDEDHRPRLLCSQCMVLPFGGQADGAGLIADLRGFSDPDESKQCDGCDGSFTVGRLNPVSGDWWLCSRCLRRYLSPDQSDTNSTQPE